MAFNSAAHEFLIANGYSYRRVEKRVEDRGNAENGPIVSCSPAYEIYQSEHEYVYISENGVADYEYRDLIGETYYESPDWMEEAEILDDRFQVRSKKDDSLLGEFNTFELANEFCQELEGFNDEKAYIVDTVLEN